MESTELMPLCDSELEEVAGGCGGRRHGWGRGADLLAQIAELDLNIDIDINIINFVGNVIQAADASAVAIEIDQGE
jgi:hypothetical protein